MSPTKLETTHCVKKRPAPPPHHSTSPRTSRCKRDTSMRKSRCKLSVPTRILMRITSRRSRSIHAIHGGSSRPLRAPKRDRPQKAASSQSSGYFMKTTHKRQRKRLTNGYNASRRTGASFSKAPDMKRSVAKPRGTTRGTDSTSTRESPRPPFKSPGAAFFRRPRCRPGPMRRPRDRRGRGSRRCPGSTGPHARETSTHNVTRLTGPPSEGRYRSRFSNGGREDPLVACRQGSLRNREIIKMDECVESGNRKENHPEPGSAPAS